VLQNITHVVHVFHHCWLYLEKQLEFASQSFAKTNTMYVVFRSESGGNLSSTPGEC